jgi:HSP20 family protein
MTMANITVRNNGGEMTRAPGWDPFRSMRELINWDPFREIAPVFSAEPAAYYPAFDITESVEAFLFRADLPGFKSEDVKVSMEGTRLLVSGKREAEHEEKTDTYYASERSFGSFLRSFTLPQTADAKSVRADLRDGVLAVTIGKLVEAQPRSIPIESAPKTKS